MGFLERLSMNSINFRVSQAGSHTESNSSPTKEQLQGLSSTEAAIQAGIRARANHASPAGSTLRMCSKAASRLGKRKTGHGSSLTKRA